ncbi:hypothetical protein LCGC14_2678280, partial [marine sediment metagenome]
MSEENDKKLYAHYKSLAGGSMKSGNPVRDELIKSDAAKHLADIIKKRPNIDFEEKPKEKETKPKVKKN